MNRYAPRALLSGLTLIVAGSAQQLASYDPAATPNQEYAAVACGTAPALGATDDLVSPPASGLWWAGATAADNDNQTLYYTTGNPAHGLQRVAFADIGTGALPTVYAAPSGYNQITGMVVDPGDATGETLFISDGFAISRYHAPTATIVAGPFPVPVGGGNYITGLAINPFSGRLWAVDSSSSMHHRFVTGGPWLTQTPAVAVPIQPTGIAFCKVSAGAPFVSYWDGTVINVQSGLTLPFPSAPGAATRRHRGLTFIGREVKLGGSVGGPEVVPVIRIENGFKSGNSDTQIAVDNPTPIGVLGADLNPTFPSGINVPGISGLLLINPASSISILLGPGANTVPLGLVGVPPGIGLRLQAAGVGAGQLELGDAVQLTTHL